jgi:hypothetical protein
MLLSRTGTWEGVHLTLYVCVSGFVETNVRGTWVTYFICWPKASKSFYLLVSAVSHADSLETFTLIRMVTEPFRLRQVMVVVIDWSLGGFFHAPVHCGWLSWYLPKLTQGGIPSNNFGRWTSTIGWSRASSCYHKRLVGPYNTEMIQDICNAQGSQMERCSVAPIPRRVRYRVS